VTRPGHSTPTTKAGPVDVTRADGTRETRPAYTTHRLSSVLNQKTRRDAEDSPYRCVPPEGPGDCREHSSVVVSGYCYWHSKEAVLEGRDVPRDARRFCGLGGDRGSVKTN